MMLEICDHKVNHDFYSMSILQSVDPPLMFIGITHIIHYNLAIKTFFF